MFRKLPLIMLFAALLVACARVPVDVDYDETVVFSGLHNYAWAPEPLPKSNNAKIDSDTLLHDRLHTELDHWLAARGYSKTAPERADFWLSYTMLLNDKTEIAAYGNYYGGWGYYRRPYWGMAYAYPNQYVYQYSEATLIVDMLDPKTRKLIWRGSIAYEVVESTSPEQKRNKIAWAVTHILQNFPPQKPGR